MAEKKVAAKLNATTGSYTVYVPKDARTGAFVSEPKKPGRIIVTGKKKAS